MARAGIDLGGTKIQTVVVGSDHSVIGQARVLTPVDRGPEGVLEAMAESVRLAASNAGVAIDEVTGIGVGSPGQIDDAAGTVSNSVNLPGWSARTVQVAGYLCEQLGVTTVNLANDVQAGVTGESRLGAGRPFNSMLGVFCGTGVGGGVVINRELWRGRGAAGEIGHLKVMPGGRTCGCGQQGCLEAYAGRAAMESRARGLVADGQPTEMFRIMERKGRTRLASSVWAKALKDGDEMARQLVDDAIWALGFGVASAVNLLDVEAVVIGGGLGTRLGEPFVARVREAMLPNLVQPHRPPAILLAELGDLGGAMGAALLVSNPRP